MDWLSQGFRLGEREVRPEDGTITTPQGIHRLGPRPMELLLFLARNAGKVVGRAEIMEDVWARVVVSDETLSRCISDLRQALGDGVRDAQFIETLPRRGYRLKQCPEALAPTLAAQSAMPAAVAGSPPAAEPAEHAASQGELAAEPAAELTIPNADLTPISATAPSAPRRRATDQRNEQLRRVAPFAVAAALLGAFGVSWLHESRRTEHPTGRAGIEQHSVTDTAGAAASTAATARPIVLSPNGIAVLPFANMSDDPGLEFFSDGLTEELLNALAAQDELEVVARTSSFAFKNVDRDIREIGRTLGVANVLEGSVRREGQRLRVTVQLIDAQTGFHRFSKTYDRPLADLLDLQEDLAIEVGAAIVPRLADAAMRDPVRRITRRPEALETYLLGKHLQRKLDVPNLELAALRFREAMALDPEFALAHAGLAETLALISQYAELPIADFRDEIETLAARALELDPATASAWHARGLLAMYERRFEDAVGAFATARRLDPNALGAYAMHARALHFSGDSRAALEITREALRRDPLNLLVINNHAMLLRRVGEYAEAERWMLRSMEIDPNHLNALWSLAYLKWITGDPEAAANWYQQGIEAGIRQSHAFSELAWVLLDLGRFDEARYWIERAHEAATDPPQHVDVRVAWHVAQGDLDGLQRTVSEFSSRHPEHPDMALYRALAALHAGDASSAVREYESLAGLATDRLHSMRDMDFGYWHALLLARARQLAGHEQGLALSLTEADKRLVKYSRDGGIPGVTEYYRAALALLRGDETRALEALEAARHAGWRRHAHARHDPLLAPLRGDPRFETVLAAMQSDEAVEKHAATH